MKLIEYFNQNTTFPLTDFFWVPLTSLLFLVYRVIITKRILEPIGRAYKVKKLAKFIYRGFDCIHYVASTLIGTFALQSRPYYSCVVFPFDCQEYLGMTGDVAVLSVFEKVYIFYFLSYYVSDIFYIKTNGQIWLFCLHHFITISLIVLDIAVSRPALGLIIMLLHDYVDVFLYVGKVASYLQVKKVADASLLIFAGLFFYLRNVCLVKITLMTVDIIQRKENVPKPVLHVAAQLGLVVLCCCHLVWGYLVLKSIKNIFFSGRIGDVRSDEGKKKQ